MLKENDEKKWIEVKTEFFGQLLDFDFNNVELLPGSTVGRPKGSSSSSISSSSSSSEEESLAVPGKKRKRKEKDKTGFSPELKKTENPSIKLSNTFAVLTNIPEKE